MTTSNNNKRIAKNTLFLYIRMIIVMAITFYTSRVVFNILGVTDFGIYNVVGGVIVILSSLIGSLNGATSRFITFELGKGDKGNINKVFRCANSVHYLFSFIILILAETLGLLVVLRILVIPSERMFAAFWVYQFSVLSFIISFISIPYNALLIAHERMNAFAWMSIFEVIAKLVIVIILSYSCIDKLISYAFLLFFVQLVMRILYTFYCKKNFREASWKCSWDTKIIKEIAIFAGWMINGSIAVMGYTQGINILLNLFFGPAINAARGIAVQIQSAVSQLCTNFQMAVRPQITKSYAQGELKYMHNLILASSRYCFFLVLLILLPLFINIDYILYVWLGNVPAHTSNLTRLMLLAGLNLSLSQPVSMAIHATGNIKKFQLIEANLLISVVPICYLFLKYFHISAEWVFGIYLIIEIITQFVRVWIVYPMINLDIKRYFIEVLFPIFKVLLPIFLIGYIMQKYIETTDIVSFLISALLNFLLVLLFVYIIGLNNEEKYFLKSKFKIFR